MSKVIDELELIWASDTGKPERVRKLMPDIAVLSAGDDVAAVDRIIEAGYYDDSLSPSDEAIDEMSVAVFGKDTFAES